MSGNPLGPGGICFLLFSQHFWMRNKSIGKARKKIRYILSKMCLVVNYWVFESVDIYKAC